MRRPLNLWLLGLVLVCAVSIWTGRRVELPFLRNGAPAQESVQPTADPEGFAASPDPQAEPVHLAVLNGTPQGGLAREIGLLVVRAGCVAEQVGNAPGTEHPESLLINRRLPRPRAEALARRLGGVRLLTEWDARCTEDAVLLLGADSERVRAALER